MEQVATRSETSLPNSRTEVLEASATAASPPVLRLRLNKPKSDRKVGWREDTVDNEHMGRKKSKCCCIFKKPLAFGESSSEDDDDCEHCFGHPEKKKKNRKKHAHSGDGDEPHAVGGGGGGSCSSDDDDPTCSFKPKGGHGAETASTPAPSEILTETLEAPQTPTTPPPLPDDEAGE